MVGKAKIGVFDESFLSMFIYLFHSLRSYCNQKKRKKENTIVAIG